MLNNLLPINSCVIFLGAEGQRCSCWKIDALAVYKIVCCRILDNISIRFFLNNKKKQTGRPSSQAPERVAQASAGMRRRHHSKARELSRVWKPENHAAASDGD